MKRTACAVWTPSHCSLTGCLLSGLLFPSPPWLEPQNVTNSQPFFFFFFPPCLSLFSSGPALVVCKALGTRQSTLALHPAAASALKMDAFCSGVQVTFRCNEYSWNSSYFTVNSSFWRWVRLEMLWHSGFFINNVAPYYLKKKKKQPNFPEWYFTSFVSIWTSILIVSGYMGGSYWTWHAVQSKQPAHT